MHEGLESNIADERPPNFLLTLFFKRAFLCRVPCFFSPCNIFVVSFNTVSHEFEVPGAAEVKGHCAT